MTCKADLEGARPDVTISLGHVENIPATSLENLILHSCVQSTEPHTQKSGKSVGYAELPSLPKFTKSPEFSNFGVRGVPLCGRVAAFFCP